jgi:intein/homing endonuclease
LRTGELTYTTVHETSLRPATPLVKLTLGSETIRTTLGHPFWVVGAGWRVAKFLKPGDAVHTMNGAAVVDAVEPDRPTEVYNLVVSDLHNYFVGQQRLLVHDNSPLEETAARIPGLVAKAVDP